MPRRVWAICFFLSRAHAEAVVRVGFRFSSERSVRSSVPPRYLHLSDLRGGGGGGGGGVDHGLDAKLSRILRRTCARAAAAVGLCANSGALGRRCPSNEGGLAARGRGVLGGIECALIECELLCLPRRESARGRRSSASNAFCEARGRDAGGFAFGAPSERARPRTPERGRGTGSAPRAPPPAHAVAGRAPRMRFALPGKTQGGEGAAFGRPRATERGRGTGSAPRPPPRARTPFAKPGEETRRETRPNHPAPVTPRQVVPRGLLEARAAEVRPVTYAADVS